MGTMMTVLLMGAQRFTGMMGGARFALGGGILLGLGLLLTGIAVLAVNIVILIKVIRMEKALMRPGEKQHMEQS